MQFDLFHSLSRTDSAQPRLSDEQVFVNFFSQVSLAEQLGFDTVWVAESHFSSEVQKCHQAPVIPNYAGEVGLNADTMQLFQILRQMTKKINFGTAIHNIVGGNGGPIASADRINALLFTSALLDSPRNIYVGFASGRFPYINSPFGIVPRCDNEKAKWSDYKRAIFLEATEIFLRLMMGEALSSKDLRLKEARSLVPDYQPRWEFETLQIVPHITDERIRKRLHFVLGSHDQLARRLAFSLTDVDVFNLSFTPPSELDKIHDELTVVASESGRKSWRRSRLPRTCLVFIHEERGRAVECAEQCFDSYIEAMRGTVVMPPKSELMKLALIGDPKDIRAQLTPGSAHGFHMDDRLMLWFEFNQNKNDDIRFQMELFADQVMPHFRASPVANRKPS